MLFQVVVNLINMSQQSELVAISHYRIGVHCGQSLYDICEIWPNRLL